MSVMKGSLERMEAPVARELVAAVRQRARSRRRTYNSRIVQHGFPGCPISISSSRCCSSSALVAMVGTKLWLASRQIRHVAAHREQRAGASSPAPSRSPRTSAPPTTRSSARASTMLEIVVSAAVLIGSHAARRPAGARSRPSPTGSGAATSARSRWSPPFAITQRDRPAVRLLPASSASSSASASTG